MAEETKEAAPPAAKPTARESEQTRIDAAVAAVKDMKLTEEEPSEASATSSESAPSGAEATPSTEPAKDEPVAIVEDGEEKKLTDKIAELARRDRDLRARESAVKQQTRTIQEFSLFADRLKSDPIGALMGVMEKAGIDNKVLLEQLSNITGDESLRKAATTDPEIEEIKRWKKEEVARREQESQRQVYERELSKIHQRISSSPDRWDAILERVDEGSIDAVFKTLDAMYQQTGELPTAETYAEAADAVEKVYREEERKLLDRWSKAKRHAQTETGDKPKSTPAPAATPKKQTLTSELQREAPQRKKPQTADERLALAMEQAKQFKWSDEDQ